MYYSDEQKKNIQSRMKEYLILVEENFATTSLLLEHNRIQHSLRFLKESARALIDGYLSANHFESQKDNQECIRELTLYNQQVAFYSRKQIEVLEKILQFDSAMLKESSGIAIYEKLFQAYANLLPKFKSYVRRKLKTDWMTTEDQVAYTRQRKNLWLGGGLMVFFLIFLFSGLYWHYNSVNPMRLFYTRGQIFWTSETVNKFSELQQKRFKIKADAKMRKYNIKFSQPVRINSLRFDPNEYHPVTGMEIDQIQLLDKEERVLKQFDFNAKDPAWKRINCRLVAPPDEILRLKATFVDMFIMSPVFPEIEVGQIRIKVRVFDRVPFLHWLFALGNKVGYSHPEDYFLFDNS